MKRKSSLFYYLLSFVLASCGQNDATRKKDNAETQKDSIKPQLTGEPIKIDSTSFNLEFFKSTPDTIEGCGDYYTYDTTKAVEGRYILLSNMSEFAIIKVNGETIFLIRDRTQPEELDEHKLREVYRSKELELTLSVTQTKMYDEGAFYEGILEVIHHKLKIKKIIRVHGQTGC